MSSPAGDSVVARGRPRTLGLVAVLVLTPLLSVALSVVLVLIILHFLANIPGSAVANGTVADPSLMRDIVKPFAQNGTISVRQFSDIVYYPIPYATPPQLVLTSKSEDRSFVIVRQDEFGFAWAVAAELKGVKDVAEKLKGARDLPDVAGAFVDLDGKGLSSLRPGEEFTWEARGVRPFTTQAAVPPFVQPGTILLPVGEGRDGLEYFQHPYATPPNVTVSQTNVKILVTTPTGFRWQQTGWQFGAATVKWTAKGIRATEAQVAEFGKNPPRFGGEQVSTVEDKGSLAYASGAQGAASFTRPFAFPPNVDVREVVVTEITPQGFKWAHPGAKSPATSSTTTTSWSARGVPDLTPGKGTEKK